ncbi:hypothetical protein PTKIN_Ptkin03bG0100400 [Pterospermum kingtungense]
MAHGNTSKKNVVVATGAVVEDTSSLFFLHHVDHPGSVLVAHPLTRISNYSSWSRSMLIAFTAKNKIKKALIGSLDVTTYYTKLRTLWDELKEFQSDPICHCSGLRSLLNSQQEDSVMQFLMGLKDSFSQV